MVAILSRHSTNFAGFWATGRASPSALSGGRVGHQAQQGLAVKLEERREKESTAMLVIVGFSIFGSLFLAAFTSLMLTLAIWGGLNVWYFATAFLRLCVCMILCKSCDCRSFPSSLDLHEHVDKVKEFWLEWAKYMVKGSLLDFRWWTWVVLTPSWIIVLLCFQPNGATNAAVGLVTCAWGIPVVTKKVRNSTVAPADQQPPNDPHSIGYMAVCVCLLDWIATLLSTYGAFAECDTTEPSCTDLNATYGRRASFVVWIVITAQPAAIVIFSVPFVTLPILRMFEWAARFFSLIILSRFLCEC
jgi:hypothetical protein